VSFNDPLQQHSGRERMYYEFHVVFTCAVQRSLLPSFHGLASLWTSATQDPL
jgi:hypothetical protein